MRPCPPCLQALGSAGIQTLVLEKRDDIRRQGGASHVHAELACDFYRLGMGDYFEDRSRTILKKPLHLYAGGERHWGGKTLCSVPCIPEGALGLSTEYLIYQGHLNDRLLERVHELKSVDIRFSCDVIEATVGPDGCRVSYLDQQQHKTEITSTYVIGADGAKSLVRDQVFHPTAWINVDDAKVLFCIAEVKALTDKALAKMNYCEDTCYVETRDWKKGRRPVCYFAVPRGYFRFGYFPEGNETFDDMAKPEHIAQQLEQFAGLTLGEDYEIDRFAPYWLRHRVAKRLASCNRCFLIGDAAQVMGPFLAQGMCHGLRAATNVAWKIAFAEKFGKPAPLKTFQAELQPHALKLVGHSLKVMHNLYFGSRFFDTVRDNILCYVMSRIMNKVAQSITYLPSHWSDAVLTRERILFSSRYRTKAVGTIFPQPKVQSHDTVEYLGRHLPIHCFHIVGLNCDPQLHMSAKQIEALGQIQCQFSHVSLDPQHVDAEVKDETHSPSFQELDTAGTKILTKWRAHYKNPDCVVVRPDKYIFATCSRTQLQSAIDELLTLLSDDHTGEDSVQIACAANACF